MNAERLDLWEGHKDRLRSLVPKALDVLARGLDHADPRVNLAAALQEGLFDSQAYHERNVLANAYIVRTATSAFKRREAARRRWQRQSST